jgi:Tfp pilus assembly protein PilF
VRSTVPRSRASACCIRRCRAFPSASATTSARQLLQKALAVNPDSIDTNFFYGEFLVDEGDKAGARPYLQKALQAPARAGQEAADEGRRAQVAALLRKLDSKG